MIFNDEDDKDDLVNSQASAWSTGLCGLQVEKRQWSFRFLIRYLQTHSGCEVISLVRIITTLANLIAESRTGSKVFLVASL